ncbi:MAG: CYTH domain-containing protein [Gammaproteobacteria bacterium]|nr:CYTH domain-containing protein [Gammaproteobacteria bacterium]
MGIEIERKFLVTNDSWREAASVGLPIKQGYLVGGKEASVRVRLQGDTANLNIKSATLGVRRQEFEYAIPLEEAEIILATLCQRPIIEKTRYLVSYANKQWEVDVFEGDNAGLIVAELELHDEAEQFDHPPWLGEEVSDDPRYYNTCLSQYPYKDWV